jgi:UDP-glucose 4-epimerase
VVAVVNAESTVLVTGVAGFIGSALARSLLADGFSVVGVDNFHSGYPENIPDEVDFIEAGVHQPGWLEQLGSRPIDTIYHIAGQSGGEGSYDDPVYDLQANVQSTLLLLQHAHRIGCRKLIYASSVSVYGNQGEKSELIPETAVTQPNSLYGVGKLASEHYLRLYAEQFGIDTVALRLFNTYGPGQDMRNLKQGILSIYLGQAFKSRHIHVKGAPERFRDLTYIDDAVQAFQAVARQSQKGHCIYNIATGVPTTVGTMIESIRQHLPFEVSVHYEGSTPGDTFGNTGSIDRIQSEIGWQPVVDFHQGMQRMIQWALKQSLQSN